ncbi:MAG TPA: hypothetical protein VJ732_01390 [Bryobacteraceae bacterium]|nr:hypothetical protein [Bryobacteraceae bacterium]
MEAELLEQAARAKRAYESANAKAKMLQQTSQDLGLTHPDGISALTQAIHIQQMATRRYAAAIKELSDFVLESKLPQSQAHPQNRGSKV